ncbi:MAG: polysaccharide biosynthesis/export family protein [Acidobacteriota bacterium]|nr:polysaccharide biosynthesis/export family protein [Acidobacteriota bacterium]
MGVLTMNRLQKMVATALLAVPACVWAQQSEGAQAPAAAPAAATTAAPAPQVDATSYVIGPEDGLLVTVWKEPQLSGAFPVRPDGMISMVLIGDVKAAGLTPLQLGQRISELLKKYVQDPSVSVVVTSVASQRIFVIGEISHVGPLQLTAGMTPLQAIAAAGGLTPFANKKHIYILRGQQKIPFNYKAALKGDDKQMIALHPGDTIVVQ